MVARFSLTLPFAIALPKELAFTVHEYELHGYKIRALAPAHLPNPLPEGPDQITISGSDAVLATILLIDFVKETFERRQDAPMDPPPDVIHKAITSFLTRWRHVARVPLLRVPEWQQANWRLQYLNDDESTLEPVDGYVRVRGTFRLLTAEFVGLNADVWEAVHGLPYDYAPPPWEALLLDARGELPKVGTAVVLASTALEVFIARILDQLAIEVQAPPMLWSWINDRGDYRLEPSLVDQYGTLLKYLSGHSLKEDNHLWQAFRNLKEARNTFVHQGTARIGTTSVDAEKAAALINAAEEIVNKIRSWLPEHLQWPVFGPFPMECEITKRIGPVLKTDTRDDNPAQEDLSPPV